jgi:DNA-binding Xre family transcriptional regulator|tara:strand:+ start:874 stop:1065 length:192 start_codon:yes stop_codon:yes gene_type:complete
MIKRLQIEYRLKELNMSKLDLAHKIGITPATLHNKLNDTSKFTLSELESLVKIGFIKCLICEI